MKTYIYQVKHSRVELSKQILHISIHESTDRALHHVSIIIMLNEMETPFENPPTN